MSLTEQAIIVKRALNEEREKTKRQEFRVRCYAEVLALYAHRLAIAQDKDAGKMIREAQNEVRERLGEQSWL